MRTLLNIDAFPLHRTLETAPCSKLCLQDLAGLPESDRHLICFFLDVFTMGRLKFVQTDFMPRAMLQQLRHYYLLPEPRAKRARAADAALGRIRNRSGNVGGRTHGSHRWLGLRLAGLPH